MAARAYSGAAGAGRPLQRGGKAGGAGAPTGAVRVSLQRRRRRAALWPQQKRRRRGVGGAGGRGARCCPGAVRWNPPASCPELQQSRLPEEAGAESKINTRFYFCLAGEDAKII